MTSPEPNSKNARTPAKMNKSETKPSKCRLYFSERIVRQYVESSKELAPDEEAAAKSTSAIAIFGKNGSIVTPNPTSMLLGDRLAHVRATVRCAGRSREEATSRCQESYIRSIVTADDSALISCVFARTDDAELGELDGVSFEVSIADEAFSDFDLHTTGGRIMLGAGTRGDLRLSTTCGEIVVVNHEGTIVARTRSGRILVHRIQGTVDAHCEDGNITVRAVGPDSSQSGNHTADMNLVTVNGNIEFHTSASWTGTVFASSVAARGSWDKVIKLGVGKSRAALRAVGGEINTRGGRGKCW